MINFDMQVTPIRKTDEEKQQFIIHNKQELLDQLKSLKQEAKINMHSPLQESIFYKDYNALAIAIKVIEELGG